MLAGLKIAGGLSLIGAVVAEIAAGSAGAGSGLAYRIAEFRLPAQHPAHVRGAAAAVARRHRDLRLLSAALASRAAALARERGRPRRRLRRRQAAAVSDPERGHDRHDLDQPAVQDERQHRGDDASAAAFRSSASGSNAYQRSTPVCCPVTSPNSTCSANQTDRLRMTPTTAAVMAASAPDSRRLARNCSMNGAPAKIHSIDG